MVDDKLPSIKRCELSSVIVTIRGRLFADASKHVEVLTLYKILFIYIYIYIYVLCICWCG